MKEHHMSRPGTAHGRHNGNGRTNARYTDGKKVDAFIKQIEIEAKRSTAKHMLQKNRDRIAREFRESERQTQTPATTQI
jgi:hypothetical protein